MKKLLMVLLLFLLLGLACCKPSEEDKKRKDYSLAYNSDGYYLPSFKLSDIKIKVVDDGDVSYVDVTDTMLDKSYRFNEVGDYNITVNYEGYRESVTFNLFLNESENSDNGYKKITTIYSKFSGNNLINRTSLDGLAKSLYVGNTIGLQKDEIYTSTDESVAKINDNNVLICLKKGKTTISDSMNNKVRISVDEKEVTIDNYYSTIGYLPEIDQLDLKTIIHNLIDEHNSGSYSQTKNILASADADPKNPNNMLLIYTGRSQNGDNTQEKNEDNGWTIEHIWPLSKVGGDTGLTAGHDAYNIRPVDVSINKTRGDLPFGIGENYVNDTYNPSSSFCKISEEFFEPRDEVKGDVARSLFYMAVRYDGDASDEADLELVKAPLATKTYEMGNLDLLLEWNDFDKVDDFESNRNKVIYEYQKNLNPFVDYPVLAKLIWGDIDEINTDYSVIYSKEAYNLSTFKLSDIKIEKINGKETSIISVSKDMLDKEYNFNDGGIFTLTISYEDYQTIISIEIIDDLSRKEYSLIKKDTYDLSTFKLSDILIEVTDKNETKQVPLTEDMLDKKYDFSKAGIFELIIRYEDFEEKISFEIIDDITPIGNNYKDKTAEYLAFSGNELNDRCSLDDIDNSLYVGNTVGLQANRVYKSSDTSVIKITDNNILVCLKKGSATISTSDESKLITVSELTLTSENYYSTIGYLPEISADDIKTILHNLIDEHNSGSYKLLKEILPKSDVDPDNSNNMILLYTGRSQGGPITSTNAPNDWNREHVWPLSKLGGDTGSTAGHDAHHIRPADVSINSARGNLEFGVANNIVSDTYAEGSTMCKTSSTHFEPRDEVKGDIARMLFYMAVRYEGDVSGEPDLELVYDALSTSTYEFGNLALLLEWNELDPVDEFEINRNNVIFTYQNNRNPFIDYPTLANLIWGNDQ